MADPVLSLSVADEFLICSQCNHPIDVHRCSAILTSSPSARAAPPPTRPRYASTPWYPVSCSTPREHFRNAGPSPGTGQSVSSVDADVLGRHEPSPLLERTAPSFAGQAPSYLGQEADFDLSGEFESESSPKLTEQLSMALCDSCSMSLGRRRELNLLGARTTPGSRMSTYFPDRTGFDMADDLAADVSRDGMSQSMNSEDSGACDVDVGLPSSDECSSHERETGAKLESCITDASHRLQTPNNRYNDNAKKTESKLVNAIEDPSERLQAPYEPSQVHLLQNTVNSNQTGAKYEVFGRLETPNKPSRVHTFNNNSNTNNHDKNSAINDNNNQAESKLERCIRDSCPRLETSNKLNSSSSYDIILTPQKAFTRRRSTDSVQAIAREQDLRPTPQEQQSRSVLDDLLAQVNEKEDNMVHETGDERFADVRRHLENARTYYHELIEQWFWKNVIALEKEEEQLEQEREQRAEVLRATTATVTKYAKDLEEARTPKPGKSESQDVTQNLRQMNKCVEEPSSQLTEVVFITGCCERLTTEHLGGVIIRQCLQSEVVPRCLLPGKCLWSFDSRCGRPSDYMATGVSVTSSGDVIVTDTGLDVVTVFSKMGVKKFEINTAPGDYPTTATEFGDTIAVACGSEVKLYDKVDGIYHRCQLMRSLSHPQGVSTDKHGHLVVSGYCVDIPTVAVYDKKTRLLNMMIHGDNRCELASEDIIGSELDELPNRVLFSKPWYITTDQSDHFLISDRDSHTICVINRQGELVEHIGSLGHKPGQFFHLAGICLDRQGCIIVADSQNDRIQVVTPDRQTVLCILDKEHNNIKCPTDVALDNNGLLYVLQGSGLVSVYQYC